MLHNWLTMAILSFSMTAHAVLEEPIELMTLTPVEPMQFQQGLCPGNPLTSPPPGISTRVLVGSPTTEQLIVQDRFQIFAQDAANAIYQLPDLESVASGAELVTRTVPFIQLLPKGYQFYSYFSEPEAGMKYMLLKPTDDDINKPYILAIAGTQSLLDWIVDVELGRAQLLKLSRLVRLFSTCQYLDSHGQPLASHGLIVTGHSLGAGLAQAVAYTIQKSRIDSSLTAMSVDLVTFNGFGGRSLIEKDEVFDERIPQLLRARNYWVEGDLVSRIGVHIGPTYGLGHPAALEPILKNAIALHVMDTIMELGSPTPLLLSNYMTAEPSEPPEARTLDTLASLGRVVRVVPELLYEHRQERIVELLNEAILTLERMNLKDPKNKEAVRYISRLIFARELSFRDSNSGSSEQIRELRALRQRLYKAVP